MIVNGRIERARTRLSLLVLLTIATLLGLAALGAASSVADVVANPGKSPFKATATGGQLKVNSKLDLDVGTMNPAPTLENVTLDAAGNLTAPANGLVFPKLVYPVNTPLGWKDIFIQVRAKDPITGSLNPSTGEVHLSTNLTIQLTSTDNIVALGNNCYVGSPSNPIPFSATALPDDSKGVHYDQYTGQTTVVDDTLAIPAASGCPSILGNDVNTVVNDALGLPSPNQNVVKLALRFKQEVPRGEDWIDPNGPGHIDPVIVNDESTNVSGVGDFRSWLESRTISDGSYNGNSRQGTTVRLSLLVKHNPGFKVTKLRIADWSGTSEKPVTEVSPSIEGGSNYSRVTYSYVALRTGMNLSCSLGGGDMWLKKSISVSAVLEKPGEPSVETDSSTSDVAITRENCTNQNSAPMIYGWSQSKTDVLPGEQVDFKFKGDDTNADVSFHWNNFGGVNWRWRNLDTGHTTDTALLCKGGNQDNQEQTLTLNKVDAPRTRGRWVLEASLTNEQSGCSRIEFPGLFFWVGAIDVNSPQTDGIDFSPEITNLTVPFRPAVDGSLAVSVTAKDTFDRGIAGQGSALGEVQSIEWDLDGDDTNGVDGFESVRLGDSRTGMGSGQNQMLLDTSDKAPGIYPVRVRVGDNGALGAADDIRRTTIASGQYMVNSGPEPAGHDRHQDEPADHGGGE